MLCLNYTAALDASGNLNFFQKNEGASEFQDISLTNVTKCKTLDFLNYLLEFLIVSCVY